MPARKDGKPYNYSDPIHKTNKNGTAGNPRKYISAVKMQQDIDEWFEVQYSQLATKITKRGNVINFVRPPYFGRLCREALKLMSEESVHPYISGDYDTEDDNLSEVVLRAKQRCHDDLLEGATIGVYNDRVVSLVLQSKFNYTTRAETKTEIEHAIKPIAADQLDGKIQEITSDIRLLSSEK